MIKKYTIVLGIVFLSLLTTQLASAESGKKESAPDNGVMPYVATFAYSPSSKKAPGSQKITFAVAKVDLFLADVPDELWVDELRLTGKLNSSDGKMFWFAYPQFENLPFKLRRDIAETLFADGFGIRGPYESYNDIPPADKKAIDFYLVPKMELVFTTRNVKKMSSIAAHVEVNGSLILEIRDIKNSEIIKTKRIPLTKIEFYSEMKTPYDVETKFNLIMNAVVKGLEEQYPALMAEVSKAVVRQELKKPMPTGRTGY